MAHYKKLLATVYKPGIIQGLRAGLFAGLLSFTMSCYYALAVWIGAKLVLKKIIQEEMCSLYPLHWE